MKKFEATKGQLEGTDYSFTPEQLEYLDNLKRKFSVRFNIALDNMVLPLQANIFMKIKEHTANCMLGALKPPEHNIIAAIMMYGSLSMSEIAEKTGINYTNLHRYVNSLEKQDFVKRVPDPNDRKIIKLAHTDKLNYATSEEGLLSEALTDRLYSECLTEREREEMLGHVLALGKLFSKLNTEGKTPEMVVSPRIYLKSEK